MPINRASVRACDYALQQPSEPSIRPFPGRVVFLIKATANPDGSRTTSVSYQLTGFPVGPWALAPARTASCASSASINRDAVADPRRPQG